MELNVFLLFLSSCILYLVYCDNLENNEIIPEDTLYCRSCGSDASTNNNIIGKLSGKALVAVNETIFGRKGVLVQILENPLGSKFEVIVLSKANCAPIHIWSTSFSWFPGYAWKLCLCSKCTSHLGWMFEPVETATANQIFPSSRGFYLLIIDNIIAESDINSVLATNNVVPLK